MFITTYNIVNRRLWEVSSCRTINNKHLTTQSPQCCKVMERLINLFFRPTLMDTSPLPVKDYNFWPIICSALMTIDQWVFLNVPHLLWHAPTLINGHLRETRDTHTPVAERLAVELSITTCFNDLGLSRPQTKLQSTAWEARSLPTEPPLRCIKC